MTRGLGSGWSWANLQLGGDHEKPQLKLSFKEWTLGGSIALLSWVSSGVGWKFWFLRSWFSVNFVLICFSSPVTLCDLDRQWHDEDQAACNRGWISSHLTWVLGDSFCIGFQAWIRVRWGEPGKVSVMGRHLRAFLPVAIQRLCRQWKGRGI